MEGKKPVKGFRLVLGYLAIFMAMEGLVTLAPLLILVFYPQEWKVYLDFLIPGGAAILLGFALWLFTLAGREKAKLGKNEDSLLLTLLWVMAFAIGALPFYLTRFPSLNQGLNELSLNMSYSESFFEATSGYTTTGLTLLPSKVYLDGLDSSSGYECSHVFLFHRAFMQFIGGVGLVLLATSLISSKNNFKLFFAEGHNDRLLPNIGRNAKLIFGIYSLLILIGFSGLWLAGMTPFDAICHSTSGIATGGFSTRANSIYFYSTPAYLGLERGNLLYTGSGIAIELVSVLIMILGATNFVLHTFLFKGQFKKIFKDIEFKMAAFVIVVFSLLAALATFYSYSSTGIGEGDFLTSFRHSSYYIISSLTTTGYVNFAKVIKLGHVAIFLSILAMNIGGGMGSTSGGLKQYRIGVIVKEFYWSIKFRNTSNRYLHPKDHTRLGETKALDDSVALESNNYFIIYLSAMIVGVFVLLCCQDVDLETAIYMWSTAVTSTGVDLMDLAVYKTSHSLIQYNSIVWVEVVAMLLGRLEIMPVLFTFRHIIIDPIEWMAGRHRKKNYRYANIE